VVADIIRLRRHHALEVLHLARDLLLTTSRKSGATGRAQLLTCEILYTDRPDDWNRAKQLLSQLVGSDKAKCITSLNRRIESATRSVVTDEMLQKQLLDGPCNALRRGNTRGSRSRSPSNSRKPNTNSNVPANPPQTDNQNQNPKPAGRGRGRNNRSRSNSRSRILTFSRDNNMSRARSPKNGPNVRSTNSLWNDSSRGRNRQPVNVRRNYNLNREEARVVDALRTNNE